ncbi:MULTISPECIES: M23 family metallopeptidase [Corynebacterium]|uniref:M23 family metallopeptidase n=1 Tax=Corynebacterium TaxID=1716 RepID=UPI0008A1D005|nr:MULTISPECIES: M23 family metallopeptidase [Corynebacterium]MCG7438864.1 M23 family metallopeptidase [Corynebacterium freneyi]OFU53868.1 peptidase M23 [Corynebacterium sp. HMSC11E11]
MGYTGRHRKVSSLKIAKRNIAMIAAFAGIATAGSVPAAGAAPMPGVGSIVQDVVDGAFNTDMAPAAVANTVVRPAAGELTSGYGPRWGRMHNGIDIANAVGTPIYAVMSGTVIDSGPASGFGNWIRIRHNDGSVSVYGHMETLSVSVGQTVGAGEYIAGMGNRGHSTGSHLHFEIHPDGSTPVDPEPWFAEHGIYF